MKKIRIMKTHQIKKLSKGGFMNKFLLMVILIYTFSFSQEIQLTIDESKKYVYSEVINVTSLNKSALFNIFKENVVPSLRDASQLIYSSNKRGGIVFEDAEKNSIILNHSFDVKGLPYGCIIYNMKIEFKDGRYRLNIYDLTISYGGAKVEPFEAYIERKSTGWKKVLQITNNNFNGIINNIKSKMKRKFVDDNW